MYDIVVIGAGPAGIALAAEARATAGVAASRLLILEKGAAHTWAIRQYYPEQKLTTANYKGYAAQCEGLLCIGDMSKSETIAYFDEVIARHDLQVRYGEEVYAMRQVGHEAGRHFVVESSKSAYQTKILAVAIGVLGRPNKPKDYHHPASLKNRLLFDITSQYLEQENVLVVGGGDTAAEYVQYLSAQNNLVTLSYRGAEFKRLNEANHAMLLGMEQSGAAKILRGSNISRIDDVNGRPRVSFKEAHYEPHIYDRVVYALGGTTPTNFLRTLGIEFDGEGPRFDEAGETSVPGLFLIGDLTVSKTGGSIITAFNSASRAIKRISTQYLSV